MQGLGGELLSPEFPASGRDASRHPEGTIDMEVYFLPSGDKKEGQGAAGC